MTIDASWEEAFPYGTFAFSNSQVTVEEGGESHRITVYRLGGTAGRATARILYAPAYARLSETEYTYSTAAGKNDILIEIEDPLPIAKYQPLGKDPEPSEPEIPTGIAVTDNGDGTHTLTLDVETAEKYQWYAWNSGIWDIVKGASARDFVVDSQHRPGDTYDYMCAYTVDGQTYGSNSAAGDVYVQPQEDLGEYISESDYAELLLQVPEQTFSVLPMHSPDEFAAYAFDLTFAHGEWAKEIILTAPENNAAEPDKFGTFTIAGCLGGSLYDAANTLVMQIVDSSAPGSTQVGFVAPFVRGDKSQGTAHITVERTGDTSYPVSFNWRTADGTALAGTDYSYAEGTIVFFADFDEIDIEIPLIDDGKVSTEDKYFTVELSNLLGGGEGLAGFSQEEAIISLYNSGKGQSSPNLATELYDAESVDVSGSVVERKTGLLGPEVVAVGTQVPEEIGTGGIAGTIIEPSDEGELAPLSHEFGRLTFTRNGVPDYNGKYWRDWLAQDDPYNYLSGYDINGLGRAGWLDYYGPAPRAIDGTRTFGVYSQVRSFSELIVANMPQRFSEYRYDFRGQHRMNYGKNYVLWPEMNVFFPTFSTSIHPTDTQYPADKMDHYYYMRLDGNHAGTVPLSITSSQPHGVFDLMLKEFGCKGYKPAKSGETYSTEGYAEASLRYLAFKRRLMSGNMNLRVYTANDDNVVYENGLPSNVTVVPPDSALYSRLKPMVSIKEGQGGVDAYGRLYVGSTLQVSTAGSASFKHAQTSSLGASVYLTRRNSDGSETVVAQGRAGSNADVLDLQLLWKGITDSDLISDYVINVVLDRIQDIVLELQPSVPRLEDGITIDPNRIPEAYGMFLASNNGSGIAIKRAAVYAVNNTVGGSTGDVVQSVKFRAESQNGALKPVSEIERTGTEVVLTRGARNLYSVNFNLSPDDLILFEGSTYKGNETIQIPIAALSRSTLSFKYYNKDYLTAQSVMTASISDVCVYLDGNGNGKLDGYFDKDLKVFIVDDSQDQTIGYFKPGVYEEAMFAPVPVWRDGRITGYRDYLVGIEYSMTPRCLVVPPGGTEGDRAQVLTALTTGATNPRTLSREQRDYRYVKSGALAIRKGQEDTLEPYSADNHLMYGAEAEALSMVYFSAGGDHNPPKRSTDPEAPYYAWNPDFRGSLMYDFENPEPVTIPEHVAGSNVQIAKTVAVTKVGSRYVYTYEDGGLGKLNGYLGSLTGLDTFALAVQQQPTGAGGTLMDTEALMLAKKTPVPESFERAEISLFPSGDHLAQMKPGASTPDGGGGSNDKGDYGEFGIDSGMKLPSIEIGLSDYITIILDGTDIGFAIGMPLGGFEQKREGSWSEAEFSNPKTANEENVEKFRNFFTGKWGSLLSDDSLKAAQAEKANPSGPEKDGQKQIDPGEMSSSDFSVSFSMALGFTFSYSQVTNKYHFAKFAITVAGALEYRYQYRFTPVPIVYVYVKAGVSVELSTGLKVVQNVVESVAGKLNLGNFTVDRDARPKGNWEMTSGGAIAGASGATLEFGASSKIYNVYFSGKILVEIWDKDLDGGAGGWSSGGYINSTDAGKPAMIILANQTGYTLSPQIPVRFTSLQDGTAISSIIPIEKAQADTYWNGMRIAPSAFLEVGAGVGVELLKFEIFAKLALSLAMSLGEYDEVEERYRPFTFDEFELTLGIGFRVVALFFNIEKEAIQYILNYERNRGGSGEAPWMHGYSSLGYFGEMFPLEDGDSTPVTVSLPKSNYATQRVYGPAVDGEIGPLAYDSTGAPFQISGYNSSGDAFTLADGLSTGYTYQVVTVGGQNYLFYTVSRPDSEITSTVDSSMLVMSKIQVTDTGGTNYGLVHPVAGEPGDYIPVDVNAAGGDDGTGDLEFKAWADGNGKIRVIWTSYAGKTTEPSEPDSSVYPVPVGTDGKTSMDAGNYGDTVLFPVPDAPAEVDRPDGPLTEPTEVAEPSQPEITSEPNVKDYYVDDGETETPVDPYKTLEEAKQAYDAAVLLYQAWEAYRGYVSALEAYQQNATEWALYNQYLVDKAAYDAAYNAYVAWKDYFSLLDNYVRTLMAVSAKNTVVKTASFDTSDTGAAAFTAATIIGGDGHKGGTVGHVFLPEGAGDGGVLFYASTDHFTDGGDAANARYKDYIKSLYGDEESASYKNVGAFLVEYQKTQNTLYGQKSYINIVSSDSEGNLTTTTVSLTTDGATPRRIENLEMAEVAGVYYLAYTTVEESYATNTMDKADLRYIRRLFLRTVTANPSTGEVALSDPYLLRTLVNFDRTNDQDGVYSGTSRTAAYQDPYFANLQFLTAKLGDLDGVVEEFESLEVANQTFLLFEMNGNTYVIPEADLGTIALGDGAGKHYGRIIPFFTKEMYRSRFRDPDGNYLEEEASTAGYTDVAIGADSDGNIAAVYTAMVPGSTNNAIYITKYYTYDEAVGETVVTKAGWSTGQILAMKDMQVYEDSVTYGWDAATTEAAYLQGITGDPATTKASQFRFGNLQFALGTDGDALVLAEGIETMLMSKTYTHITTGEKVTSVVPAKASEVGFYAVAFGQGQQAIGQSNIRLTEGSFKAGKYVKASVSFDNVGDTRIRGSETEPITVQLIHHSVGADDVIATWEVIKSIVPGQEVSLVGLAEMKRDAKDGDYFYFTIAEDPTYAGLGSLSPHNEPEATESISAGAPDSLGPLNTLGGGTFFAQSTITGDTASPNYPIGRYIVQALPDLGFEYTDIESVGVTPQGDTILTADFYVSNRGAAKAYDVFAQFSYQKGVDENGDPTFAALDLTGSQFEIFNQTAISDFGTLGDADLRNGVLRLVSTENQSDGDDIDVGFGREVSGTFYAPPANYYVDPATGTKLLKIRVEVFSSLDQTGFNLLDGLYTASGPTGHAEVYSLDNEDQVKMGHKTYFSTAQKIAIPMGNTLLLPITIETTREGAPVITVSEHRNHDIEGDIPDSLGVLYYDPDIKCVVIVPSCEGNGVIRVSDTMTGYSADIAFTVTEATMGINIFDDNDMFTFYNKDDTEYDPDKSDNDWSFIEAPEWGLDGEAPYLSNLSRGNKGAYFKFDTVASEIDFYFGGEISVDSTYPEFSRVTGLNSSGGNNPADARKVQFGDNKDFFAHTVTVTVTSQTPTVLDKYVETYASPEPPKPAKDAISPQIYWSRSFPDIASIEAGTETVSITCYVVDDNGVASLTLNGETPTPTKSGDNRFWQFDWNVSENGAYTVQAKDISGNTTSITVNVGWFNVQTTGGAIATAPALNAGFKVYAKGATDGTVWGGGVIPKDSTIELEYVTDSDATAKIERFVYTYDLDDPTKVVSAGFAETSSRITQNGVYRVTATLLDGTWSSRILNMTGVDTSLPVASLSETIITLDGVETPALAYSVTKDPASAASLVSASINGASLSGVSGRRIVGTWLPPGGKLYNGEYTLAAEDTGGNMGTATAVVAGIKVDGSNALTVTGAYNQARDNGAIAVDPLKAIGGKYVVLSPQNEYYGSYQYAMVSSGEAFAQKDTESMTPGELAAYDAEMREYFAGLVWEDLTRGAPPARLEGLTPGDYVVYIRDQMEPEAVSLIYEDQVTVADEAISFTTVVGKASYPTADDGSITVTASGGKGGNETYQFAILEMEGADLVPVDSPDLVWLEADNALLSQARATFGGLVRGTYQVAVRGMYGVTAEQLVLLCRAREAVKNASLDYDLALAQAEDLEEAKSAYDAAQSALDADTTGDPDGELAAARDTAQSDLFRLMRGILGREVTLSDYSLASEDAWERSRQALTARASAEADYDTRMAAAESSVTAAYSSDATLWDNACTSSVTVGYYSQEEPDTTPPFTYDSLGRAIFRMTGTPPVLTLFDQILIRNENLSKDVILSGHGLTIMIPAGAMGQGDNLNNLIPDLQGVGSGASWVVVYTDDHGIDRMVPWSQVGETGVTFIAAVMGRYKVVSNPKTFGDTAGHWAQRYIDFITARELFLGTGDGMFSPDIPMTRAMFVTVLGRLVGVDESQFPGQVYDDVPAGTWYSAFVRWASENGIVEGYGDGRFGPNDPVTREQMCTMLVRYLKKQGITLAENESVRFADGAEISRWAVDAVALCQKIGLVEGIGENRFSPAGMATRAQVAAIYMRLILGVISSR